jgi:hypothetical protein
MLELKGTVPGISHGVTFQNARLMAMGALDGETGEIQQFLNFSRNFSLGLQRLKGMTSEAIQDRLNPFFDRNPQSEGFVMKGSQLIEWAEWRIVVVI